MADFEPAFARLMDEEGVKLSNNPADRGKQTYAGVSRKYHPNWVGWRFVDAGGVPPLDMVRDFYRENYWARIRGDQINSQRNRASTPRLPAKSVGARWRYLSQRQSSAQPFRQG